MFRTIVHLLGHPHFFVRTGHYAITDLFTPDGIHGVWAWRGILALAVGIAAEIPFMVLTFYRGIAAQWLSEVDISFLVGLALAGGLYYLLTRPCCPGAGPTDER